MAVHEFSKSQDKIYTLKEYVNGDGGDIIDPFGGSLSDYQRTRDELEAFAEKIGGNACEEISGIEAG